MSERSSRELTTKISTESLRGSPKELSRKSSRDSLNGQKGTEQNRTEQNRTEQGDFALLSAKTSSQDSTSVTEETVNLQHDANEGNSSKNEEKAAIDRIKNKFANNPQLKALFNEFLDSRQKSIRPIETQQPDNENPESTSHTVDSDDEYSVIDSPSSLNQSLSRKSSYEMIALNQVPSRQGSMNSLFRHGSNPLDNSSLGKKCQVESPGSEPCLSTWSDLGLNDDEKSQSETDGKGDQEPSDLSQEREALEREGAEIRQHFENAAQLYSETQKLLGTVSQDINKVNTSLTEAARHAETINQFLMGKSLFSSKDILAAIDDRNEALQKADTTFDPAFSTLMDEIPKYRVRTFNAQNPGGVAMYNIVKSKRKLPPEVVTLILDSVKPCCHFDKQIKKDLSLAKQSARETLTRMSKARESQRTQDALLSQRRKIQDF